MKFRRLLPCFAAFFHMILTILILFLAFMVSGSAAKFVLFFGIFLIIPRLMTAFLIASLTLDPEKALIFRPFLLTGAIVESIMAIAVYFFDYVSVARTAGLVLGVSGAIITLALPVCFCLFNLILALYLLSYKGSAEKTVRHNEHYLPEFRETVIEE